MSYNLTYTDKAVCYIHAKVIQLQVLAGLEHIKSQHIFLKSKLFIFPQQQLTSW